MSTKERDHRLQSFEARYYKFPINPKKVSIDGFEAYEYISGQDIYQDIVRLSAHVRLNSFDLIFENEKGGGPFANKLAHVQKYDGQIYPIEYHPDGRVVTPIPEWARGLKIAVIEDIQDTRRTTDLIRARAPDTFMIFLLRKRIPSQIILPESVAAIEIDEEWVLGYGLNGETGGDGKPKDWGRTYRGIAVKITEQQR